ncbi:MAG: prephenate dehydratase [Janthinobacterium lividum]
MDDELSARLAPLRDRIDALDTQLLALLNERARVALQVGEVKHQLSAPVFKPERERQVIERLQGLSDGPLRREHIAAIWREIMSGSRALEKTLRVAFLGPVGTYSEQAALQFFGASFDALPSPSSDEVFRAVEAGAADYGVVAVENSTEGAVSRTLDRLLQSPLPITAEIALPIRHNLLTLNGGTDGILKVYAHSQALAQCQQWLSTHLPRAERLAVSSNAEGARLASLDATAAAIAGDKAAVNYGLQISFDAIQDDPHNRTRFFVLGGDPPAPTEADQTSLILSVKNEAGAVFRMLEPFARHGVSMTRFESRPARSGGWSYFFYIDVEGHRDDAPLAAALEELKADAAFVKILGSYPRAH